MTENAPGSAADETPDQTTLDSINAVVENARPDEDFGSGLAQGSAATDEECRIVCIVSDEDGGDADWCDSCPRKQQEVS